MTASNKPDSQQRSAHERGFAARALGLPGQGWSWLRGAVRQNRWFTVALAGGALLRLIVVIGYPGALWFAGDSYVYLGAALRPQPNLSKTTGYSLFLRLLLPFHSLTLVTVCQHLMGLGDAMMIYWLLRRNGVSKKWSTIATLPVLFDGFMIEDEHLIMAEAVFTFCVMLATLLVMRTRTMSWWTALIGGLLLGYAGIVRTEGLVFLAVYPLFLLARGWRVYGWKKARAWIAAIAMALGCAVPVLGYALWFQSYSGSFGLTLSQGYYLWGRVSSFADCAVIKPTGEQAVICPKEPLTKRTPPGNFIWHAPEVHQDLPGGPVTAKSNTLLTDFAIHAVEAQPLGYAKAVGHGLVLAFSPQRENYPGAGTAVLLLLPPARDRHPAPLVDQGRLRQPGLGCLRPPEAGRGDRAVRRRPDCLPARLLHLGAAARGHHGPGPWRPVQGAPTHGLAAGQPPPPPGLLGAAWHLDVPVGGERHHAGDADRDRRLRLPLPAPRDPVRLPCGGPGVRAVAYGRQQPRAGGRVNRGDYRPGDHVSVTAGQSEYRE